MSTHHERAAAAALLAAPEEALALGGALWSPDDFVDARLRRLVEELLADPYGDTPAWERAGLGPEAVSSLLDSHITVQSVAHHLRKVGEAATLRRVAIICQRGIEALNSGKDPVELVQRLVAELEESGRASAETVPIRKVLERVFQRLDRGEGMPGTATGLGDLDYFLPRGGLPGGLITVVGAETGGGKSAFANTCLFGAAARGSPGTGCTFEDSADSSVNRALAARSRVDAKRITRGQVADEERKDLVAAAGKLDQLPLEYLEQIPESAEELCAILARDIRQRGTRIVVLDYIQLVRAGHRAQARTAREHIDYVLGRLQRLAKRSPECAFVVVSQFQRDKDRERSGRPPILGDLKESSCIEQYAKLVLLLWRPLPADEEHPDHEALRRRCMLLVRKNTEGEVGRVALGWDAETVSYRDLGYEERGEYLAAVKRLRSKR